MSTDRELLELAAKAAGINILDWVDAGPRLTDGINTCVVIWNPINNDGDAFRLAVILRIEMYHRNDDDEEIVAAGAPAGSRRAFHYMIEFHGDSPESATRRAIVRAAAAIGESMP